MGNNRTLALQAYALLLRHLPSMDISYLQPMETARSRLGVASGRTVLVEKNLQG